MAIKAIKHYVRYKSADFYSVSGRHYFTYNGMLYNITKKQARQLHGEIKKYTNPLSAAEYLVKEAKKGRFKKS